MSTTKKTEFRLRYAPSPTGTFHIGGARTALFNYLFAKKNNGKFIIRIEDTDQERSEKKYEEDILKSLKWLGLLWDEGPDIGGDFGPYRQSEREKIYEKYIKKMFDEGHLYWCFCTKEELEVKKQDQIARSEAPKYTGSCRNLTKQEIEKFQKEGRRGVLRFKTPIEKIRINDLIRGKVEFDTKNLGDMVIARDFKTPLYNLAVVIDDNEMKINFILRGEDHLSNTPKQILFLKALGFEIPEYAHMPLTLGEDRSKLSKRHGAKSIKEYQKEGYLPQAFLNFIALLGWNPGTKKEIFSLGELADEFEIKKIQKGGAIFNSKKLDWFNGFYIRKMDDNELTKLCIPYLIKDNIITEIENENYKSAESKENFNFNYIKKIVSINKERLKKLSEIVELSDFFFKDKLEYDIQMLAWKEMTQEELQKKLNKCYKILEGIEGSDWQGEKIKELLTKEAEKDNDRGKIFWPLRVALSGKKFSPPPFDIAETLGKEKTLKRINEAITLIL